MNELRKTELDGQGQHFFGHASEYGLLPWREWMRTNLPKGSEGFAVEDLDAIVTIFGRLSPDLEKFMLVEFKQWGTQLDYSQLKTLRLLNYLLRRGDPKRVQYRGVYVVEWPRDDSDFVRVNYRQVLRFDQLQQFFLFRHAVKSLFDS